jgi:Lon protease-like protein
VSRFLPVFPLGVAVLPTQVVPLHIFENRYRALMQVLSQGGSPAELGMVLIERGSEVGGGEVRTPTGTVVHLIEAEELPDGRWVAIFAGSHPFRVHQWLPDDPYPQALVDERPDGSWDPDDSARMDRAEAAVRRALTMAAQLGDRVGHPGFALSPEPAVAAWELCERAPLGALDRQRLLEAPDRAARLDLLVDLAEDVNQLLAFRLHGR